MTDWDNFGIPGQVFIRVPGSGNYCDQRVNLGDRDAVERHRESLLKYCRTAWRKNSTPERVAQIGLILALLDAADGFTFYTKGGPTYDLDQQRAYDIGIEAGLCLHRQQLADAGLDTAFVDAKIAREEKNKQYMDTAMKASRASAARRMELRVHPIPLRIPTAVKG